MGKENNQEIDKLTLITGQSIIIGRPVISLYQPTLKELGSLGQTNFYSAAVLLAYPKKVIKLTDESMLEYATDFDIIMTMLRQMDDMSKLNANITLLLMSLLFKDYSIKVAGNMLLLEREGEKQIIINSENYEPIKQAIIQMFCLEDIMGTTNTEIKDTDGPMVRRIKEKFKKRHEILAKQKGGKSNTENDLLSRYMSIVSIGLHLPLTELSDYTVYQLFDGYKRAQLKDSFDFYIQRVTSFGCVKKEEKVVNWQKNLSDTSDD